MLRLDYIAVSTKNEEKIEDIRKHIRKVNEPSILIQDVEIELRKIKIKLHTATKYVTENKDFSVIPDVLYEHLRVKKGNLTPKERQEIENHVLNTYNFLKNIPWPEQFKKVPDIAFKHHERLNGTGYPTGIFRRNTTASEDTGFD